MRFHPIALRTLAFLIGGIFIYAGVLKVVDPVQFARDLDNYKMLPWPVGVATAFYIPWLEIFCGVAVMTRRCYAGALGTLAGLITIFIFASVVAKLRGLDISCGCFGHASKGWSFGWHLILDLGLIAGLVLLFVVRNKQEVPAGSCVNRRGRRGGYSRRS